MNEAEYEKQPFSHPDEELQYLRERLDAIERREKERGFDAETTPVQQAMHDDVKAYQREPRDRVLTETYAEPDSQIEHLALNLSPEPHDSQMAELLHLMQEKGIRNTLAIVDKMNNPHLEDDFHRFLVAYVREGYSLSGLKEREPLRRSLSHTLFEIIVSEKQNEEGNHARLSETLASMEQLYLGLMSLAEKNNIGQPYFTLELALPSDTDQYSFYASIPNDKITLFEKQVTSIFPTAQVIQQNDDYNIFNMEGEVVGSYAQSKDIPLFPIRTYDSFEHDPLNVILNSFSKLEKVGEGAAIQLVLSPDSDQFTFKQFKQARDSIKKGSSPGDAFVRATKGLIGDISLDLKKGLKDMVLGSSTKKENETQFHDEAVEQADQKISTPLIHTNIRLLASSDTEQKARVILDEMESAFNQFENTKGNTFTFQRPVKKKIGKLIKDFTFRFFDRSTMIPLNVKELTTILHLDTLGVSHAHGLKSADSIVVPPPSGIPHDGILLGKNVHRGSEVPIHISPQDRLRHLYAIGQTGTGKTTLLKNMIIQDIRNGEGVCMIDPHGVDVNDVLACVPEERMDDVIYFDPSDVTYPMGLNMLEYDRQHPELKTFVVNEMFSIFQKLYSGTPESMGPMFEQYFRNATGLVIEDPDSGNTLLDVSRVLSNKAFRDLKISRCKNPVIVQFWNEIAGKAGGEASLANIVPYITSKFDVFLANEIMRPIVAQEHSAFNFRDIMDSRKILLVNLSKGRLGDANARLLGMILVGKILMASLSRSDVISQNLPPFYLYIDEFQNFTTDSISTILSEARKYKLSLNLAHQFIAQLDESIKDAVFGNVGTMTAFRVGSEDAHFLEDYFQPSFDANNLMNVNNYQAHLKLLVNGKPTKPFTLQTLMPDEGDSDRAERLKQLSKMTFGRRREDVESEILKKYDAMHATSAEGEV